MLKKQPFKPNQPIKRWILSPKAQQKLRYFTCLVGFRRKFHETDMNFVRHVGISLKMDYKRLFLIFIFAFPNVEKWVKMYKWNFYVENSQLAIQFILKTPKHPRVACPVSQLVSEFCQDSFIIRQIVSMFRTSTLKKFHFGTFCRNFFLSDGWSFTKHCQKRVHGYI